MIIKDRRILIAMQKRGLLTLPDNGFYYVDDKVESPFMYKGVKYSFKYFSGCFYPFVVRDSDHPTNSQNLIH